jgi:hypothetical protein
MRRLLMFGILVGALSVGVGWAQTSKASRREAAPSTSADVPTAAMTLATVRIPRAVKADDQPLAPGTYTVRLAGDPLKPATGETPNLEQWVEFLRGGKVRGKAVASIVPLDQVHAVAKGSIPARGHARVELLKGDDYVRVWINKAGDNYLIHLPTATS